ncbi:hypothetical protein MAP00_003241 [Monascus purpureus]|nr:hypothetical protein MAP00_003241 [Monascus purpureus]
MIDQSLELLDVNESDDDGCTALHCLVKNLDQVDAVRHLVSRGADVNAIDQRRNTPLYEVMKGTMLRMMYEHGNSEPILERLKHEMRSFKSCWRSEPPKNYQDGRRDTKTGTRW